METISDRIRIIREKATGKKITQDEFAQALGISRSRVTNLEDAEKRLPNGIPERMLRHICEIYHVHYLWLTTGEGPMMNQVEPDMETLIDEAMAGESELSKSIMKAFAKLPDKEWAKLKKLIDQIDRKKAEGP